MHPDIVKFWESNGYTISIDFSYKPTKYWFIQEKEIIVAKQNNSEAIQYYFNTDIHDQNIYSESEMLKRIKMKAFV